MSDPFVGFDGASLSLTTVQNEFRRLDHTRVCVELIIHDLSNYIMYATPLSAVTQRYLVLYGLSQTQK